MEKKRHIKRARYAEDSCGGHRARNGEEWDSCMTT